MIEDQMNKSVFLIEEMNIDQEPTEEEVFERADQLEIDDLSMARQSLTKQIQPHWKPYCNRYQEVYYINLQERKAYIDHPIDMQFKILYAKKNRLPIPNFKSFKIQQIATNINLIDREIEKYRSASILNVVYQDSDQHESSVSVMEQSRAFSEQLEQLRSHELKQLYQFQAQFAKQNQKWLRSYREEKQQMLRIKQENIQMQVKQNNQEKYGQAKRIIEAQIDSKNKNGYKKKVLEIQQQIQNKKTRIQNLLEKQLAQRRSLEINTNKIHQILKNKMILANNRQISNFWQQQELERRAILRRSFTQMQSYFTKQAILLNQNTNFYQQILEEQLKKMEDQVLQSKYRRRKSIFKKEDSQFIKQNQQNSMKNNFEKILQRQIQNEKIWETDLSSTIDSRNQTEFKYPINTRDTRFKPSLTLRLWKQIF